MTEKIQENQPAALSKRSKVGLAALFAIAVILIAYFTFVSVRNLISTWNITSLPGIVVKDGTSPTPGSSGELPAVNPTARPAPPGMPTPLPWDGASRVTVLVMGLDYRDWVTGEGPPRTDTMILFTIDPLTNSAGMLTVPRDLWVSIPGFNYGKINTAYQLGEAYSLPGGGPGLAINTVEGLLGVPIQYYALIDFFAFIDFIDEIGGAKLDIQEEITIDLLGEGFRTKKTLEPGVQTLPGEWALAYARARYTEGGDFDRSRRQMQVVMAIRDRFLNVELLPSLISKAPALYADLSAGITTNLDIQRAIQLAWLAQKIPDEDIRRGVIGEEQVSFGKSPDGLDILKPITDQIRLMRDMIFTPTGPISPVGLQDTDLVELMAAESAQLSVFNGTFTPGLAGLTSEYLQSMGADVAVIADADEKPHAYTSVFNYTGSNPYMIQYLVDLMNISDFRIFNRYTPESEVDVAVILGQDWVANNPMP